MKIQGTLTVEGVKLLVNISAPDDVQEVYVANVHPSCLVIPKDRFRVEHLGLPKKIVEVLHRREIFYLGQLVDGRWDLGVGGFTAEVRDVLVQTLRQFREIALTFDLPARFELESLFTTARPAGKVPAEDRAGDGQLALENDIGVIGLLKTQEEELRNQRKVQTLGDLLRVGRKKLIMSGKMDDRGMQKIEAALREFGFELSDDPQASPPPASVTTE